MAKNITLTAKDKFNALANAKHIFAFKEEETKIQILEVIDTPDGTKAVVMTEDGEIVEHDDWAVEEAEAAKSRLS